MSERLGSGLLFKNFRKRKENHPDYRGENVSIRCPACSEQTSFEVAAWLKKGRKGEFFSLSITLPQPKPEAAATPPEHSETATQPDDIPF